MPLVPMTTGFFGRHDNIVLYVPNLIGACDSAGTVRWSCLPLALFPPGLRDGGLQPLAQHQASRGPLLTMC